MKPEEMNSLVVWPSLSVTLLSSFAELWGSSQDSGEARAVLVLGASFQNGPETSAIQINMLRNEGLSTGQTRLSSAFQGRQGLKKNTQFMCVCGFSTDYHPCFWNTPLFCFQDSIPRSYLNRAKGLYTLITEQFIRSSHGGGRRVPNLNIA